MGSVVTPVTVSGRYFWKGDKRFVVNGIIYSLDKIKKDQVRVYQDVLAGDLYPILVRSIPLLKELGINTLFVYYIDETKNHDDAMNLLAKNGIYVLPCLCGPNRDMNCHRAFMDYTSEFLASCFRTIDVMSRYDNTLGFVIADEWIDSRTTSAAPYLRALTRDVKKYMALNAKLGQRVLPVGISVAPIPSLFNTQFDYFSGGSRKESIDFFAINDRKSMSVWAMLRNNAKLINRFNNAHIPVFFSQYGNNDNDLPVRTFFDVQPLYAGAEMLRVFSGGVVNEFFDNPHGCGLARASTSRMKKTGDFYRLKAALARCFPPRQLDRYVKPSPADDESCEFSYAVIGLRGGDSTLDVVGTASAQGERPMMPRRTHEWKALHQLPESPFNWDLLEAEIEVQAACNEWVPIDLEDAQPGNAPDEAIEDLTFGIRDELIVDDDVSIGSDCNNGGRDYKGKSVCRVN